MKHGGETSDMNINAQMSFLMNIMYKTSNRTYIAILRDFVSTMLMMTAERKQ